MTLGRFSRCSNVGQPLTSSLFNQTRSALYERITPGIRAAAVIGFRKQEPFLKAGMCSWTVTPNLARRSICCLILKRDEGELTPAVSAATVIVLISLIAYFGLGTS